VEVQALVDSTHSPNPRRVCVGLEQNRLAMLLAVLSRHGGVPMYDQDVFVNIVGGMRITETGIDLAALMAIASSLKDKPIDSRTVVFGEVGLSGEIRPVQSGQERIREAAKQGFTTMVVPKLNAPQKSPAGVTIHAVDNLQAALGFI
jgi:DNA repair protein RadA/Sms